MKKALKIILIILAIAFISIQFFRPERTNPPVSQVETLEATAKVPKDVQAILNRSCKDCHSNETVFPWYSNVAPVSWSVVDHIRVGREELNFSEWGTYSQRKKERKLEEICEEAEEGEMPHYQYLWVHWDAALTKNDVRVLCEWTKNERLKLESTDGNE